VHKTRTQDAKRGIPEENYPAAFALWIAEITGGPVPRFEKVEPGDEQILLDAEQRELDSVPSALELLTSIDRDRNQGRRLLETPAPKRRAA
jgi:hypothetical protein